MPKFKAVAHIRWELPFPLRLPPRAFLIWEPGEKIAALDPRPRVGDVVWKRTSSLLAASEVFPDLGLGADVYPEHHYGVVSELSSGKQLKTALLTAGPEGGFIEARPYTVTNLFFCLREYRDHESDLLMRRASEALNNVLDAYRFLTMDPLARAVTVDLDCYFTLISVADVPKHMRTLQPDQLLRQIGTLPFSSVLGQGRAHHVGLNSFDDLLAGEVIPSDTLKLFDQLIRQPHRLELHHQLVLSGIRRLKRNERALAVIDGQSAFESLVGVLTFETLSKASSRSQAESDMAPGGKVHTLQQRLKHLDKVGRLRDKAAPAFIGSDDEKEWRADLYNLRNRIVHAGLRTVSFEEGKAGLVAGLRGMNRIQGISPEFARSMNWSGAALELGHIQQSSGRIARFFES